MRKQSIKMGTTIFTETVTKVELSKRPFKIWTSDREVTADTIIIATGAVARRLEFPGSGEDKGFWNKGISACAVCDGAAPIFRKKPIAVIGGGDTAMVRDMCPCRVTCIHAHAFMPHVSMPMPCIHATTPMRHA